MGCIYRIFCKTSGKSYIGQSKYNDPKRRFNRHVRDSLTCDYAISRAIKKYGEKDFDISVLCICDTQEELDKKEDEYITIYNSMINNNGYNMIRGGKGVHPDFKHKEEHKKYMSEKMKGRINSPETCAKISKARTGQKNTWNEATKAKVAELSRKKATGVIFDEERKRKIGEKSKGRQSTLGQTRTSEQREKISSAKKGTKLSEECKRKMSEERKERYKRNPNANNCCKFTDDQIRYIRTNPDNLNQTNLAVKFKVCSTSIKRIKDRISYKHVIDYPNLSPTISIEPVEIPLISYTVKQLKEKCKERNILISGTKAELIERLNKC